MSPATQGRTRAPIGPRQTTSDRRTRRRLRELCDEVLASYRVATERDIFTDSDRREARALLGRIVGAR